VQLYRRELVNLDSEEGVTLLDCLAPAICNDDLRIEVVEMVRRGKERYGMGKEKDDVGNVDKKEGEVSEN
jgi:hypothetical protein